MRLASCIAACALWAGSAWASAAGESRPVLDRIAATNKIVLAHRESSIPFSFVAPDGKPQGYALELCQRLAEAVRRNLNMKSLTIEYTMVTPSSRIPVIAEGKADLECGSTTNNAERRKSVAFTVPHYITGARYLVRANSTIGDLREFEGKRLVSTKGTTPIKAVEQANRERMLRIELLEAPDHGRAMEMVDRGEADGFVMDDVLLYGLIASHAQPERFKVVGRFLTIEPLAIMLSKDDPAFKKILDDEMRRLILSGEARQVYERWFLQPIPPRNQSLNLPMNYLLRDFWKYPTDVVPF
jgi:glutamate/aspartate transport system substrate-binding protein